MMMVFIVVFMVVFIVNNLGKFYHDFTVLPNPGINSFYSEIIPSYGRTITLFIIFLEMEVSQLQVSLKLDFSLET